MNHFAYLIEDQDEAFFTGLRKRAIDEGLTKEGSTIGELIKAVPKAGAILKPKLSKLRKVASQLPTEIEILKLRALDMGSFGLTKMAAELMCELELDEDSTADELDDVFNKLAGTAIAYDLKAIHDELVPTGLSEAAFMEWSRNLLKEAGVFNWLGKGLSRATQAEGALAGLGRAARGAGAEVGALKGGLGAAAKNLSTPIKSFRAERAARLAAHGGKELGAMRSAISSMGARAAAMPAGGRAANIASKVQGLQAAERKMAPVQAAHQQRADVLSGKGTAPVPTPAPGKPAPTEAVPTPATEGAWAKAPAGSTTGKLEAASAVEKGMNKYKKKKGGGGMMDSINKMFRGEKLSPEERAHVIKAGIGAFAIDRYALHGGRSE